MLAAMMSFLMLADLQAGQVKFPLEKNQASLLPQRFEYEVIGDSVRIGDVLLNSRMLSLRLVLRPGSRSKYQLDLRWPAGLLPQGSAVIKDNFGKILLEEPIDQIKSELMPVNRSWGSKLEGLRASVAKTSLKGLDQSLLESWTSYPFLKFCIQATGTGGHAEFCSKEFSLTKKNEVFRPSYLQKQAGGLRVEINGKVVDPEGYIFLEREQESVLLFVAFPSGVTMQLFVRRKPLRLRIVSLDQEAGRVLVEGQGADLTDERNLVSKQESSWVLNLDSKRPRFYIKGEADIPLRQEFVFTEAKEFPRLEYLRDPVLKTLSSSVVAKLPKAGFGLKAKDDLNRVELDGDSWRWSLLGLKKGQDNERSIQLVQKDRSWMISENIQRGYPFSLELNAQSSQAAELSLQWWLSTRIMLGLGHRQWFSPELTEQFSLSSLDLAWRLKSGFNVLEPSSQFGLSVMGLKVSGQNLSASGLSGALLWPLALSWLDWPELRFRVPLLLFSNEYSISSSSDVELNFVNRWGPRSLWKLGLRNESYLLTHSSTGLESIQSQASAQLALQYIF